MNEKSASAEQAFKIKLTNVVLLFLRGALTRCQILQLFAHVSLQNVQNRYQLWKLLLRVHVSYKLDMLYC